MVKSGLALSDSESPISLGVKLDSDTGGSSNSIKIAVVSDATATGIADIEGVVRAVGGGCG